MRKFTLLSVAIASCLAVGACSFVSRPSPTDPVGSVSAPASDSSAPFSGETSGISYERCVTKLPDSHAGMLEVTDVWSRTDSIFFGYRVVTLSTKDCLRPNNMDTLTPSCGQHFPWILGSIDQANRILANSGVSEVVDGTIRGDDPVPAGAISQPQEVREKVLYLDRDAGNSIVTKFAKVCAKPFSLAGVKGFRTKILSLYTGSNIDAFLVVGDHGLIWLEFDEPGWTEMKYHLVLKKAVHKSQE